MYVISINDCGEERNFLATSITFSGGQVNVTINGLQRKFELGQLVGIEAIDVFVDAQTPARFEANRRCLN